MKISVIVPTYKPQEYLFTCLESLANQTFQKEDFEIILVLNGCSEPYQTEIETFIANKMSHMNVYFIHSLQAGVSNARNVALSCAKGEYVTFIDDDDFVSPSFLEEMFYIASNDTISLCYPYAFIDGDMTQLPSALTTHYIDRAKFGKQKYTKARKFFSGPCMKLIPRDYVREYKFDTSLSNGEDCLFMFMISKSFKYVDFASTQAIYYRRYRDNSAVTTKQPLKYLLSNWLNVMFQYTRIYFKNPMSYNLMFYITRMLGALKNILSIERKVVQTYRNGR